MFCPYFQDVLELLKNDSIFYLDGSRRYDRIKFKGKTDEIVSILIQFLKRQKNGSKIIKVRIFR